MHLQAVLFDLDNTLILFDETRYFQRYMELLSLEFGDMMPPMEFHEKIFNATKGLLDNNGRMLNSDYFRKLFTEGFGTTSDGIWERFSKFYARDFDELREFVSLPEGAREAVCDLKDRGFKLVIASNPILPLSLQQKRISWAMLGDVGFDLITHIGNMSYCKPQLGYYREVCKKIGVEPPACLMVGNDPVNDMVVSRLGMLTYLTTDSRDVDESSLRLSREIQSGIFEEEIRPHFEGPVRNVPRIIDNLV